MAIYNKELRDRKLRNRNYSNVEITKLTSKFDDMSIDCNSSSVLNDRHDECMAVDDLTNIMHWNSNMSVWYSTKRNENWLFVYKENIDDKLI